MFVYICFADKLQLHILTGDTAENITNKKTCSVSVEHSM